MILYIPIWSAFRSQVFQYQRVNHFSSKWLLRLSYFNFLYPLYKTGIRSCKLLHHIYSGSSGFLLVLKQTYFFLQLCLFSYPSKALGYLLIELNWSSFWYFLMTLGSRLGPGSTKGNSGNKGSKRFPSASVDWLEDCGRGLVRVLGRFCTNFWGRGN